MTDRIPVEALDPAGAPDGSVPTVAAGAVEWGVPQGGVLVVDDTLPDPSLHPDELAVLAHPEATTTVDPMLGADGLHPTLAGMTHLADAYVAALTAAGKTPAAGTPVYAYGDSWTAQNHYVAVADKAINQLVSRLSLGALNNRAVGGDMMEDIAARAIGIDPYAAGTGGIVFFQVGVNDLQHADTATKRKAVQLSARALLAAFCAAERIEQTAFTYTGTWGINNISASSGGSNRGTDQEGASASVSITTAGTYYLLSHGRDTTPTIGGVLTITQGGTTLATLDLGDAHVNTTNVQGTGYGPAAVRIPNVQAGTLTITFSKAGRGSTATGYIDALVRISDTPPTILGAKPVKVLDANRQRPTLLAYIRDLYDTLAAEFGPSVVIADPAPGWAPDGEATVPGGDPELWFSDGADWKQPIAAGGASGATPTAADVTVTPTGNIAATDVQAALAELDSEKIPSSQKGAASGVATLGPDGKVPAGQLPSATAGTAAGTSFAPTTSIAATNVQAAIEELAAETVPTAAVGAVGGVASLGPDGKVPSSQLPAASAAGITVQDENGNVATGVTQLDFQGAGVTASAGTGEVVVTVPGGSGSTVLPLDARTLHATYGDDFAGPPLGTKWSRFGSFTAATETFTDVASWLRQDQANPAQGSRYLQAAPSGDFEIVMKSVQWCVDMNQWLGPMILGASTGVAAVVHSASEGVWAGRVTGAGVWDNADTKKPYRGVWDHVGGGHRTWWSLKKVGNNYTARLSFDGQIWGPAATYAAAAFTPTLIGFGCPTAGTFQGFAVDWFDVVI